MTVANVLLERNRVRLVSDTVGYRGKEPVCFNRKVYPVEHAGLAYMVRGFRALALHLQSHACEWADFDSAILAISEVLEIAPARLIQGGNSEVTIIGWSEKENGPRVARLLATAGPDQTTIRRFDLRPGVYLAPSLGCHSIPADMTDDQLLKVAILQQEIATRHGLNICVGGDVELTTVDAGGISIQKIGEYPNKAFTAERIAKAPLFHMESAAA